MLIVMGWAGVVVCQVEGWVCCVGMSMKWVGLGLGLVWYGDVMGWCYHTNRLDCGGVGLG